MVSALLGTLHFVALLFRISTLSPDRGSRHVAERFARRVKSGHIKLSSDSDGRDGTEMRRKRGLAVLAIFNEHDASIAVSQNGRVKCVLEMERLYGVRYYRNEDPKELSRALDMVKHRCGKCPHRFDVGVVVGGSHHAKEMQHIVQDIFQVNEWRDVHHHKAHALLGFHASPFQSALVISYDGGSPDGSFHAYVGSENGLRHVAMLDYNMGFAYNALASLMPEVTGNSLTELCREVRAGRPLEKAQRRLAPSEQPDSRELGWAGKLMGYAAIGEQQPALSKAARQYFKKGFQKFFHGDYEEMERGVPDTLNHAICKDPEPVKVQRALAASVQLEFQHMAFNITEELLYHVGRDKVEGIILTGGCALNVLTNQAIYDGLLKSKDIASSHTRAGGGALSLYVPPSPNDGGLTVGALWDVLPPKKRHPLQYIGFRLWDEASLDRIAHERGAARLSAIGGVQYLAELLTGAENETQRSAVKPIIAVVRGRQEYGPRALGHRSLLAVPDSNVMRERMNRLKFREWYRPVAPMIADEALVEVFGQDIRSPYMELAPFVRAHVLQRFPALAHLDGTARHQSVGKNDEPWLHALLLAVGKITGLAALINTSFNTRGKPIVNTVEESLRMLDELADLDYVLIEDWLFKSPSKHVEAVKGFQKRHGEL